MQAANKELKMVFLYNSISAIYILYIAVHSVVWPDKTRCERGKKKERQDEIRTKCLAAEMEALSR